MESSIPVSTKCETSAKSHGARRCEVDAISRWAFRKQYKKRAMEHDKLYIKYLEGLLESHCIHFDRLQKANPVEPCHLESIFDLERYTEDYCLNKAVQTVEKLVENVVQSSAVGGVGIGLHTGHHAVASTPEQSRASTDVVVPRDTCNGLQCQICRTVFDSKNRLFQHLEAECLKGQLCRSAEPDRAHRRRWKARARKRNAKRVSASCGGPHVACEVQPSGGDEQTLISHVLVEKPVEVLQSQPAEDKRTERVGQKFRIIKRATAKDAADRDTGKVISDLEAGVMVNVMEQQVCEDHTIRARIDQPLEGWISLRNRFGDLLAERVLESGRSITWKEFPVGCKVQLLDELLVDGVRAVEVGSRGTVLKPDVSTKREKKVNVKWNNGRIDGCTKSVRVLPWRLLPLEWCNDKQTWIPDPKFGGATKS
mmetsp:Transcript_68320/g.107624  ORF Transcript_68320/g.107624 Transcript_68320/m.107624 type:complete len:425 (+) Transcript_68320:763-2037(+)